MNSEGVGKREEKEGGESQKKRRTGPFSCSRPNPLDMRGGEGTRERQPDGKSPEEKSMPGYKRIFIWPKGTRPTRKGNRANEKEKGPPEEPGEVNSQEGDRNEVGIQGGATK